jgi:hypothetical protein
LKPGSPGFGPDWRNRNPAWTFVKTKFSMLVSYRPRLEKFDKSLPASTALDFKLNGNAIDGVVDDKRFF